MMSLYCQNAKPGRRVLKGFLTFCGKVLKINAASCDTPANCFSPTCKTILLSIIVTSCKGIGVTLDMTMNAFSRVRRRSPMDHGSTHLQTYLLDEESYRCAMSLRSELTLIETLLKVSKQCLCPKLKTYANELHERRVKLKQQLKMRSEEEKLCA
jgi:hypothetical protein